MQTSQTHSMFKVLTQSIKTDGMQSTSGNLLDLTAAKQDWSEEHMLA
jgi:hypothetical protein